jgi:hypothetical protein
MMIETEKENEGKEAEDWKLNEKKRRKGENKKETEMKY